MADLGVQGRNGAQLALEEANAAGGVAGRELRLEARDDSPEAGGALAADQALVEAGMVALVGHMLSSQALEARNYLESWGGPVISPTVSSPWFTGLKDHFYRVMPTAADRATALADHAFSHLGLTSCELLGDVDNPGYTRTFNEAFARRFTALGGVVTGVHEFRSHARRDWEFILVPLEEHTPAALLATAGPRDVASLGMRLTGLDERPRVLCPSWPCTPELLQAAGVALRDAVFVSSHTEHDDSPRFRDFAARYEARFGFAPNFAAAYAFEAATVIIEALRNAEGDTDRLNEALARPTTYAGVYSPFHLDEFGDALRGSFLLGIENCRFVTLDDAVR
jgi:branched-chain amino acid transport system substrate-binding protein